MCLRSAKLSPVYQGETYIKAQHPLTPEERQMYLQPTAELDFKTKPFETWLAKFSLLRGIFGNKVLLPFSDSDFSQETSLQFAYR